MSQEDGVLGSAFGHMLTPMPALPQPLGPGYCSFVQIVTAPKSAGALVVAGVIYLLVWGGHLFSPHHILKIRKFHLLSLI